MQNTTVPSVQDSDTLVIRPTAVFMILQSLFPLLLAIAIGAVSLYLAIDIIMAAALLPLLYLFYRCAYLLTLTYHITPERLIYQRGVLSQRRDSIELYRIRDYQVVKPLLLRLFGAMNLSLLTTDETHPVFDLEGITGRVPGKSIPLDEELRNRVELLRDLRKVREID